MIRNLDLTFKLDSTGFINIEINEPDSGRTESMLACYHPEEHPDFNQKFGNEIYSWFSLWMDELQADLREEVRISAIDQLGCRCGQGFGESLMGDDNFANQVFDEYKKTALEFTDDEDFSMNVAQAVNQALSRRLGIEVVLV